MTINEYIKKYQPCAIPASLKLPFFGDFLSCEFVLDLTIVCLQQQSNLIQPRNKKQIRRYCTIYYIENY